MVPIEDFVNKPFKVLIGTDHGGFEIKQNLVSHLQSKGVDVEDLGPYAHDPADDYPDFANAVAGRQQGWLRFAVGCLRCAFE